ncbi:MAG: hypothetical protein M1825_003383 [Sarcosagium campestre]|nr:MAG: hypothetical protein M1825_003383 [Sarcosagium campestre]
MDPVDAAQLAMMADLGNERRAMLPLEGKREIVNVDVLDKHKRAHQEGTKEFEKHKAHQTVTAGWKNFKKIEGGEEDPFDALFNSGQSHRARMTAELRAGHQQRGGRRGGPSRGLMRGSGAHRGRPRATLTEPPAGLMYPIMESSAEEPTRGNHVAGSVQPTLHAVTATSTPLRQPPASDQPNAGPSRTTQRGTPTAAANTRGDSTYIAQVGPSGTISRPQPPRTRTAAFATARPRDNAGPVAAPHPNRLRFDPKMLAAPEEVMKAAERILSRSRYPGGPSPPENKSAYAAPPPLRQVSAQRQAPPVVAQSMKLTVTTAEATRSATVAKPILPANAVGTSMVEDVSMEDMRKQDILTQSTKTAMDPPNTPSANTGLLFDFEHPDVAAPAAPQHGNSNLTDLMDLSFEQPVVTPRTEHGGLSFFDVLCPDKSSSAATTPALTPRIQPSTARVHHSFKAFQGGLTESKWAS